MDSRDFILCTYACVYHSIARVSPALVEVELEVHEKRSSTGRWFWSGARLVMTR